MTPVDTLLQIAAALAAGDCTPDQQRNYGARLANIAREVHTMRVTLDGIARDAEEHADAAERATNLRTSGTVVWLPRRAAVPQPMTPDGAA